MSLHLRKWLKENLDGFETDVHWNCDICGLPVFPLHGDNLLQQSISLLRVQDPLFKRMGASRLSRFAVDDGRRMKVVEMGGAQELLKMLDRSKDDQTRKQALRALLAVARSDSAAEALHETGALPVVHSTPISAKMLKLVTTSLIF